MNIGPNITLGFIGAGNMARSLIGGLLKKGFPAQQLMASDPSAECLAAVEEIGVAVTSDNVELVTAANIVVLAVKPQVMSTVLDPLKPCLAEHKPMLISIAAGINCSSIESWAGAGLPIVRCMPNTPALLQEGATALFANSYVQESQKKLAQTILDAVGLAIWVDSEGELDAVTAVSGSGPAYFFLLMELMEKAGEQLGLDNSTARSLTLQTALGAARMAMESDVDSAELRRRVTSPNGTTQAALESFAASGIEQTVTKALQAAHQRSIDLARELS